MSKEELLKKYYELYGADAPEPPEHLLPIIIEMVESGQMTVVLSEYGDELNKLSDELGDNLLDKDNPLWGLFNNR